MTISQLFRQAHVMTKQIIKQGDCYRTTFGLCLKAIKSQQASQQVVSNNVVILFVIAFIMFINKTIKTVKKVLTADNIAKAFIVLPIVFMFAYFLAIIIAYRPTY